AHPPHTGSSANASVSVSVIASRSRSVAGRLKARMSGGGGIASFYDTAVRARIRLSGRAPAPGGPEGALGLEPAERPEQFQIPAARAQLDPERKPVKADVEDSLLRGLSQGQIGERPQSLARDLQILYRDLLLAHVDR